MSERAKIEDRLRRKEQEVAALDDKLRAAKVYVHALKDVLKLLEDEDDDGDADSVLRPGSAVAQARDAILARNSPTHISDLLKDIGREVTRESKASLTSSLAAYVRKGEIFTRPAPSTFGLVELGHKAVQEPEKEPPADFGASRLVPPDPPLPDDDEDIPF